MTSYDVSINICQALIDGGGVERGEQELTAEAADSFKIFDDNDGYEDGYGDGDDETGSTASKDPHERAEAIHGVEGEGAAASHRTSEDDADGRD
jgi:hypothetical protein